jgi:peptide chain release factor 1
MWDRLQSIEHRFEEIEAEMARPEVAADFSRLQALAKERASIEDIVTLYRRYRDTNAQLASARSLLEETGDPEITALAADEVRTLEQRLAELEHQLKLSLLPKDPRDERDVIVEIRAGTGGEEAALFAADLYRMYTRYAQRRNWSVEVLSSSQSDTGGFKEIIFEIHGRGAYSRMKYESGIHRVQRVPVTEQQGRIHTSAATVAVLPEVEDVEVHIDEKDLRVDIFHSSGAGGQNVNKVATAVRVTHLPTGIVVTCQDERSQLKNRVKAMAILRARLFALEQEKRTSEITESRRAQVGSGDRSEKIRTYNFPQNRVTDHRINLSIHNLEEFLDGDLDPLIDALATDEQTRRLEAQLVQAAGR